jgi:hypothetical protein
MISILRKRLDVFKSIEPLQKKSVPSTKNFTQQKIPTNKPKIVTDKQKILQQELSIPESNLDDDSSDEEMDFQNSEPIEEEEEEEEEEVTNIHIIDYLNEIQSKISNNLLHINRWLQKISNDNPLEDLNSKSKKHWKYFCIPDVFIWSPHLLVAADLNCLCGNILSTNGWAKKFRRYVCVSQFYWVYSRSYVCPKRSGGCGKSFTGSEPDFLMRLPNYIGLEFPIIASKRGGISKLLLDIIVSLEASAVGPGRIRALVLELHSKRHTQKQVQYY